MSARGVVSIAVGRLRGWVPRARVELLDPPGELLPGAAGEFDLSSPTTCLTAAAVYAEALIGEAHRLLAPTGRLCVVSLAYQETPIRTARIPAGRALASRWPPLLGGCTPIELRGLIRPDEWELAHREVIERFGITSEIVVAVPGAITAHD